MRNWKLSVTLVSFLFFLIALCSAFHVICECVYLYIFMAIQFHFSLTLLSIDTFRKFVVVVAAVDWLKIRAKKGYRIKWVQEEEGKKRVKAIRADFKWIISAVASETHTHTHYIGCMNKTCPFNEYCEMTKVSNA